MIVLRSLMFLACYVGVTTALSVYGTIACRSEARALALGRLWGRVLVRLARWVCGIVLVVEGREHLPVSGAALIASQHQSAFDTMVWMALLPSPSCVLKRELTRLPLFGPLLLRAGMIPVDRAGGGAAIRGLMRAAAVAAAAGRQLVIFPEGTRVRPGTAAPLHSGVAAMAARTRLPVIPVRTDSGLAWGRDGWLRRPGVVRLRVLPRLPAELGRAALMARLEAALNGVDNSVGSRRPEFAPQDSLPR